VFTCLLSLAFVKVTGHIFSTKYLVLLESKSQPPNILLQSENAYSKSHLIIRSLGILFLFYKVCSVLLSRQFFSRSKYLNCDILKMASTVAEARERIIGGWNLLSFTTTLTSPSGTTTITHPMGSILSVGFFSPPTAG
jgi:hypothetical protein